MGKPFAAVQVTLDECDGSFERMLRRFVRRVRDEGTVGELRRRTGYVKPSQARRRRIEKSSPR